MYRQSPIFFTYSYTATRLAISSVCRYPSTAHKLKGNRMFILTICANYVNIMLPHFMINIAYLCQTAYSMPILIWTKWIAGEWMNCQRGGHSLSAPKFAREYVGLYPPCNFFLIFLNLLLRKTLSCSSLETCWNSSCFMWGI